MVVEAWADTARIESAAEINQFDLAFIVDTTGSMGGLIAAAQRRMVDMVDRLSTAGHVDLRLGIVEYRDHPPQDPLVYRVYQLTGELRQAKESINRLKAEGGGDVPEAVLAGVVAACRELAWRPHARRIAVLVGDAPPHGVGCGRCISARLSFGRNGRKCLSEGGRGGRDDLRCGADRRLPRFVSATEPTDRRNCFAPTDAIDQIQKVLAQEFGQLDFDRRVHDAWLTAEGPTVDPIADQIGVTPPRVAAAVSRLRPRVFGGGRSSLTVEDESMSPQRTRHPRRHSQHPADHSAPGLGEDLALCIEELIVKVPRFYA